MPEEETKPVGCTRHNWIKANYLIWYGATIYHNNFSPIVETFCGNQCSFPACLGEAVRSDETKKRFATLPNDDGAAQKRAIARAHANGLLPDPEILENRLDQQRLWVSDEDREGRE